MRIGYLVPEFPGSTHIFFWRELRVLEECGVACDIVSTRKPAAWRVSHDWSPAAMARTTYLLPPKLSLACGGAWELIRSGPRGWARVLRGIFGAEGIASVKGRIRMIGVALAGGELARLARRRGWRHVHVHSCANSAHIGMFAHLLGGLPYSLTLHGHLGEYGPDQKNKWKHAAFGIVITRRLLDVVRHELNGNLPAVVEVAPMGVELRSFDRRQPYRPWEGSGRCRIFSCGRLNPTKGHDHLIQAIGLLRDQGIDVELRVAGGDDYAQATHRQLLEAMIDELKLHERVTLLGAVSEEIVRRELEEAHVFALASRRDELGVATMEAMAMSLPVVISRTGGVPEMVEDGKDGLLVPPENPSAMAAAITRVLRDPQLARTLGAAAKRRVQERFHSGVSAQALMRHICGTAALGGAPPKVEVVPQTAGS